MGRDDRPEKPKTNIERFLHCGRNDRMTIDAVCAAALSANKCDGRRPPRQLKGRALSRPIFVEHDGAWPSLMGQGLGSVYALRVFVMSSEAQRSRDISYC